MVRRCVWWCALALLLLQRSCWPGAQVAQASMISLRVDANGMYRVTFDELRAAGFGAAAEARERLQLTESGHPVPVWLDDAGLVFYGRAPEGRYVSERSYVLQGGTPTAFAVAEARTPRDCGTTSLDRTVHVEQNNLYAPKARDHDPQAEPWFGYTLRPHAPVTVDMTLPDVPAGVISATVRLWGASADAAAAPDHHVTVTLGGQPVADWHWDGAGYYTATFTLAAGDTALSLVFDTPGDTGVVVEQAYLDWIDLRYAAPVNGASYAEGSVPAGRALALPGFARPPAAFDVGDPLLPVRLKVETPAGCASLVAQTAQDESRQVVVVGEDGYRRVARLVALRPGDWATAAHRADEVILSDGEFVDALAPLVAARQAQGLTALVVPVDEVYDAFGGGLVDPNALREFLRYTQAHWQAPAPRYVLLAGDASYDYKGYLPAATARNRVPAFVVEAEYTGETVSDEPYADLDGDGRPELAVGRWPASTRAELARILARTTAYAQPPDGPWRTTALFIADPSSPDFAERSDRLVSASGLMATAVVRVYAADPQAVREAWNRGAWLVNYMGHGSLAMWGKDGLMSAAEVAQLQDAGGGPLVLTLTCLSGYYAHPAQVSLGEELLWAQAGGAVAVVSATSLTLPEDQEPFGRALIRALSDPETATLGDALLTAQRALDPGLSGQRDVINTFVLLGDPGLRLLHDR
jgi:hypothetical protein